MDKAVNIGWLMTSAFLNAQKLLTPRYELEGMTILVGRYLGAYWRMVLGYIGHIVLYLLSMMGII